MHQLGIHQFAEEWITKLAWSDWSPGEQGDGMHQRFENIG